MNEIMSMIAYREINESELSTISFTPGTIYFCTDSLKYFIDAPEKGSRVPFSDIINIDTETARNNIIAPIPDKFYFVKGSKKIYLYTSVGWVCINPDSTPDTEVIYNVPITSGNQEIPHNYPYVDSSWTGVFHVNPIYDDLVTESSVTVTNDTITVCVNSSHYPVIGEVVLTKRG